MRPPVLATSWATCQARLVVSSTTAGTGGATRSRTRSTTSRQPVGCDQVPREWRAICRFIVESRSLALPVPWCIMDTLLARYQSP